MYKSSQKSALYKKGKARPSIKKYIEIKQFLNSLLWRIENGEMFVCFNGKWITEIELNKIIPDNIVPYFGINKENPNKKHKWVFN